MEVNAKFLTKARYLEELVVIARFVGKKSLNLTFEQWFSNLQKNIDYP